MKFKKLNKKIISFALVLTMVVGGPAAQAFAYDDSMQGTSATEVYESEDTGSNGENGIIASDEDSQITEEGNTGSQEDGTGEESEPSGDITDETGDKDTDNGTDVTPDGEKSEITDETGNDNTGDAEDQDNKDTETDVNTGDKDSTGEKTDTDKDSSISDTEVSDETADEDKKDEDKKADEELKDDKAAAATETDKTPSVSGKFTDSKKTTYKLTVSNVTLGENDKLEAGVYSQKNGKDDLVWVELKAGKTGDYTAEFAISQFKNPGAFTAEICINRADPTLTYEFTVPSLSAGSVKIVSVNALDGTAVIKVSDITSESGVASVYADVKSASSKSYTYELSKGSDGIYTATINIKKHKNSRSKYTAVIYAVDGNGFTYKLGTKYADLTEKDPEVTVNVKASGRYYVTLNNVRFSDYASIKAAVWSDTNGQDDLKWFGLTQGDGKIKANSTLSDFKHFGKCNIHIYGITSSGEYKFLTGKTFETTAPSAGKITSTIKNNGKFTVNIKNLNAAYTVSSVKVAVWSASDQSDLKWYTASNSDTTYSITGTIRDHSRRAGKYYAHVYVYTKRGPSVCIGGTTFTVKENAGTISYSDCGSTYGNMQKTYKLKISGIKIPGGVSKVEFAVWNTSDTSNIRWYTASVASGGYYYVKVPISNYKKLGQYVTHVYVTENDGTKRYLNGAKIMNVTGTATGKTKGYNPNTTAGTFRVSFSKALAPSGVKSVSFAVWTKDNQNDIKWYDGTLASDGKFKATVNIANHKYNSGTFHIHVYATMGNGIKVCASCIDYNFAPQNFTYAIENGTRGTRTVGISNPSVNSNVMFAIWSETNGQDDLVWYSGNADGTNWTTTFKTSNHKHYGNYIVHIYSGGTFLGATTFYITESEYKNGWTYEDGYWFYYDNGVKRTDLTGMVSAPYRICVNRTMNTVTVYGLNNGSYNIPVIAFTCSVGVSGMETPTGTYYTDYKSRWELLMGPSYGQYATHVVEGIYIHSVAGVNMTSYNLDSNDYNNLGRPASHGCIRLNVRDAKWIYDNCPYGTEVYIYDSSYAGPFGKPDTIKIPDGQTWDPTDPAIQ